MSNIKRASMFGKTRKLQIIKSAFSTSVSLMAWTSEAHRVENAGSEKADPSPAGRACKTSKARLHKRATLSLCHRSVTSGGRLSIDETGTGAAAPANRGYSNPFGPMVFKICLISSIVSCWSFLSDILTNRIKRSVSSS